MQPATPNTITLAGRSGPISVAVAKIPPRRALLLMNRLLRIVGPGLAPLLNDVKDLRSLMGQNLEGLRLGDALAGLFERLTDTEVDAITTAILEVSSLNGAPLAPQLDFVIEDAGELLKLLRFGLEVQFSGFFSGLRAVAASFMAARDPSSSATSPSPGPSGA